eukprot:9130761-Ditylum_brightwellii.AAC.1
MPGRCRKTRIPRESWSDPGTLHAEKPSVHQESYRKGVGSLSTRAERVPQGFSGAQCELNTAAQQGGTTRHSR